MSQALGTRELDARTGLTFEIVDGRNVAPDEREMIVELLERAFGGWPRMEVSSPPLDHLRWKLEGPPGQPSAVILVRDGSRIVALTLCVVLRFLAGGRECRVRLAADAAVDPEYQGRGIDSARRAFQVERLEPEFDLTLAHTTNPALLHGHLEYGNAPLGNPVGVLFKVVDAHRALGHFPAWRRLHLPVSLGVAGYALARPWMNLRRRRSSTAQPSWSLRTVERFDGRMDEFAVRAAESFDFIQLRDTEYLNWRFCDARAGTFTARLAEEDGAVLGFCVVKASSGRGYVADLLALPGRTDVVGSLIEDAIRLVREAGGYGLDCWMTKRHAYTPILREYGFIDRRSPVPLSFRSSDPAHVPRCLRDPAAKIHLMTGDSDLV